MSAHIDRCDKCGAEVTFLDAGFCPTVLGINCPCGGTWRHVIPWNQVKMWTQTANGDPDGPVYADRNADARAALIEYRDTGAMSRWWLNAELDWDKGPEPTGINWDGIEEGA